jgi:hypothetical protein
MKKWLVVLAACVVAAPLVSACDLAGGGDEATRVTFALVTDTREYDGKKVYATVSTIGDETVEASEVASVQGVFESYPGKPAQSLAKLTTDEEIATSERYVLDFFVDMDGNDQRTTGDLTGVQGFDVMPDETRSEAKYFRSEFQVIP